MMSVSAVFSYGAEERFVISNIEKSRKLSTAEAFRRSTHCHPPSFSSCMYQYTYFYTFSDLFFVFLRRDEHSVTTEKINPSDSFYINLDMSCENL